MRFRQGYVGHERAGQSFRGGLDGLTWENQGRARKSGHGRPAGLGKREPCALARAHRLSLGDERRRREMVLSFEVKPFRRVPMRAWGGWSAEVLMRRGIAVTVPGVLGKK